MKLNSCETPSNDYEVGALDLYSREKRNRYLSDSYTGEPTDIKTVNNVERHLPLIS